MPNSSQQSEKLYPLDAAALHPDLHCRSGEHYYRQCAAARTQLKELLVKHLAIQHDLFLLANTSHGLLAALAGLALEAVNLDTSESKYPPYTAFGRWSAKIPTVRAPLLTHVDPLSGHIEPIPKAGSTPIVVDAAHSFATIVHHRDVLRADVFICPLHKHAGIAAGLGLLAIKPGLAMPGLRSVASVAESGTACLFLLETAVRRILAHEGRILNRLILDLDPKFREKLAAVGVVVLTPAGAGLPFICLQGAPPQRLVRNCRRAGLFIKFFRDQDIVRISGATRGSLGTDPEDRSAYLQEALLDLLR